MDNLNFKQYTDPMTTISVRISTKNKFKKFIKEHTEEGEDIRWDRFMLQVLDILYKMDE